jgi:hypothetical protein
MWTLDLTMLIGMELGVSGRATSDGESIAKLSESKII